MTEISLRDYFQKLDNLLRLNAADEVIHHCRHLLQFYPKNVAAYRFLGRALLINGRYEDAGAVFRRVLSAVPDDYHSNLGLGEVYDHVRKADEAIWYTERAFEQEPNNQRVLDTLRDLYRRYRNIANARVQLTSAAVARQALRNRQYDQAIETLRNALDRRPERVDLRLLLARTLWENGERVDAAEAALDVLQVLPDCLEANRILTQLWLDEDRPSDAQRYLNRIEALDPYLALELVQGRADDQAFRVEELDYRAAAQTELTGARPEWLSDIAPEALSTSEAAEVPSADQEGWTNWMSSMLTKDAQQDSQQPLSETADLEEELTDSHDDWMASMAQNAVTDALRPVTRPFSESSEAARQETPASDDLFGEFAMPIDADPEPEKQPDGENLPPSEPDAEPNDDDAMAWLREAGVEIPDEAFTETTEDVFNSEEALQFAETTENELDWLSQFDEEPQSSGLERTAPESGDELAWLSDVDAEIDRVANAPALDGPISGKSNEEPLPDWLTENDTFLDEALGIEALQGEDAPADDEGADHPAEAVGQRRATAELDDWMASESENAAAEEFSIHTGDLPDLFGETSEDFEPPPSSTEILPDWLSAMETAEEEPSEDPEDEQAAEPASRSLRGLTARLQEMGFDAESSNGQSTYEPTGQTANLEGMEEWMRQFGVETPSEDTASETPEWLTQIEDAISAGDHAETPAESAETVENAADSNSYAWMSDLTSESDAGITTAEPADATAELLDWLEQTTDSGAEAFDEAAEVLSQDAPAESAEEFDWLNAVPVEDTGAEIFDAEADQASADDLTDEELDALFATPSEAPEGIVMTDENLDALFGDDTLAEEQADEFISVVSELDDADAADQDAESQPEPEAEASDVSEGEPTSDEELDALFARAEEEAAAMSAEAAAEDADLDALFAEAEAQAREFAEEPAAHPADLPDWLSEMQPESEAEPEPSSEALESELESLFRDDQSSPDAGFDESEEVEPIAQSEYDWSAGEDIADEFLEDGEFALAEHADEPSVSDAETEFTEADAHTAYAETDEADVAFAKVDASEYVSKADLGEFGDDLSDELGDLLGEERQEAIFEEAASASFEDDLALDDVEPHEAEFDALELDDIGETVEPAALAEETLDMAPADNAPDWLNAMVPGLDLDYDASEDEPLESEFADESEYEGSLIEPSTDEAEPEEETDQAPAEREFGWLVDIVDEETQQVTAVKERRSLARFIFRTLPRWFKRDNPADTNGDQRSRSGSAAVDNDLPEWLR